MKFTLSWLNEFIPLTLTAEKLAETLTLLGLEVDHLTQIEQDVVLELSVTPNLAHALSMRGIARELSVLTSERVRTPKVTLNESSNTYTQDLLQVDVQTREVSPRYVARVLTGLKINTSPEWLKKKIECAGMRSVNQVVDLTNLILLEYGQPLHAFDLDKLAGQKIEVRYAKEGEKITTLDGISRFLTSDTLVIADEEKPVAIAGIMGSLETAVTETTTRVVLEAAYFEPALIRKASKRLGISSEASKRFERGIDPLGLTLALDACASLIHKEAGGEIGRGTLAFSFKEFLPKSIELRLERLNQLLGSQLAMSEVETILKKLGFHIEGIKNERIEVVAPSYRVDIHQEIDLIEEVARIYGYSNFEKKEVHYQGSPLPHHPLFAYERELKTLFLREGLQEFLTCNLIGPEWVSLITPDCFPTRSLIKLLNPSSLEQSILRPSLLPNLLQIVKHNFAHDLHHVYGFEIGKIHFKSKERYLEPTVAALVLCGKQGTTHWSRKEREVDFFDLKGILENIFSGLNIRETDVDFTPSQFANFHPFRQATVRVKKREVGIMGELHPALLKTLDIGRSVFFAEIDIEELGKDRIERKMKPLPTFPSSYRDWTLSLKDPVPIGNILKWIREAQVPLLEEALLLDIYENEKGGDHSKNVTFRMIYRNPNKTSSVKEVEECHKQLTEKVLKILEREANI